MDELLPFHRVLLQAELELVLEPEHLARCLQQLALDSDRLTLAVLDIISKSGQLELGLASGL